jgi:hypothetical protein
VERENLVTFNDSNSSVEPGEGNDSYLVTFNDSNSSVEPGEGNDSYRYIEPRES